MFRTSSFATTAVGGQARQGIIVLNELSNVSCYARPFNAVQAQAVVITRAAASLDLYVASVVSAPFPQIIQTLTLRR